MSFAAVGALLAAALVLGPLIAHFLSKGSLTERPFPATRWLSAVATPQDRRRNVEDRALLATRVLVVLALSVLGATPLLRRNHPGLDREKGGSVALGLVFDDSLSMQTVLAEGLTRFDLARKAALALVNELRTGDRVSIVLAGKPVRMALAASSDPALAKQLLSELEPSDRGTDLEQALTLVERSLDGAPQQHQELAVFSDFAAPSVPEVRRSLLAPLPELGRPSENCGVARAERTQNSVRAEIACTSRSAARGRQLALAPASLNGDPGKKRAPRSTLARQNLVEQVGLQTILLRTDAPDPLDVTLSGQDELPADDTSAVAPEAVSGVVGVVCAFGNEPREEKRACPIEQGLEALGHTVRPLGGVPAEAATLTKFAALFVDNPPGFIPEVRAAVTHWLEAGGIALVFVGDHAEQAPLGSSLEPFASGRVPWIEGATPELELEPSAPSVTRAPGGTAGPFLFLGSETATLEDLGASGRARLQGNLLPQTEILMRWEDGTPWLVRRSIGRGLAFTVGLPSSIQRSDLAVRPGFLALLDAVRSASSERLGPSYSAVGEPWLLGREQVDVRMEGSRLPAEPRKLGDHVVFEPAYAGRYSLRVAGDGKTATPAIERIVHFLADEIVAQPLTGAFASTRDGPARRPESFDASRYMVFLLAGLVFLELWLRQRRRRRAAGEG